MAQRVKPHFSQPLAYLRQEAALGQRRDFEQFLRSVPDVPAQADDALTPDGSH